MCNIAQSVNVIAPLLTHPTDPSAPLLKQTIYFPYLLFSKYMRGTTLAVHLRCPEYDGKDMHKAVAPDGTDYAWMQSAVRMPWLDVSATVSEGDEAEAEGERKSGTWVCLAVTNVSEERDFAVEMEIKGLEIGKEVKVYEVCNLGQKDPWVKNTWEERENVGVRERTWKAEEMYTFPRLSLTLLRWKI
jgi:alpha-N-arabinofuranosidase